jgi:hypothetical protein
MSPSTPISPLTVVEHERLADLLAVLPASRYWAVSHMHGPLLCALGLLSAPDAAYARAVERRFGDPADNRRRALALLDELTRDARVESYEQRRRERRRAFRFGSPARLGPRPGDDRADQLPRSA